MYSPFQRFFKNYKGLLIHGKDRLLYLRPEAPFLVSGFWSSCYNLRVILFWRASVVWFGFLVLAFVNGGVRELVVKKFFGVGELSAHQIFCFSGVALWTVFFLLVRDWLGIKAFRQAIAIGAGWFIATMLFETFILNRKMTGPEILATYNVLTGQLWGLVLIWIGLLPMVFFAWRRK